MTDQDVDNLGHRRWLLSNSLGPIGVGSTSSFSCLQVLTGSGDARARWVTWPPPGDVPVQALHIAGWMDVDKAGWSIQSDYIDLRGGEVTVTRDGIEVATDVWELDAGYLVVTVSVHVRCDTLDAQEALRREIRHELSHRFSATHLTVELIAETDHPALSDRPCVGGL